MLREELTIKILDRASNLETITVEGLRTILDDVMYDYEIQARERSLIVASGFGDKVRLYLASKKLDGLSNLTLKNYWGVLSRFAMAMPKDIETVTAIDIRRYMAAVAAQTGISKATMGKQVSMLKTFFAWLQDQEYITRDPMRQIKLTKTEKRMRKSLTSEELERLRDGCKTDRQRALIEFLFATGCRLAEIHALDIGDLNWSEMTVRVIGKGNKEREVNFTAKARLYLRKYLNGRTTGPLFLASKSPFGRLACRSIEREIDEIAKTAGFDKSIYPHLLRHTTATLLLKAGMAITDIQTTLGHSSPATTMVYATTDPTNVRHDYQKRMAVG